MQNYNPVEVNKILKIKPNCKLFIKSEVYNFCIELENKGKQEKWSLNLSEKTI